ncbi:hypothetical protein AB0C33_15330 [Nonomuraea sp. NPDC048881]|uniref:hypothetical protein n=1 Tax=Nonomuraea sp. NPDC048881 TaxID=3155030 RepID=UPI0033CFD55F
MYRQALGLAQEVGSPFDEAHALEGIARCAAAMGNLDAAVAGLCEAVETYRMLGVPDATTVAKYVAALKQVDESADS